MDHDEPGRTPGRSPRGAVTRAGGRQPSSRGSARRSGGPRRTGAVRGGASRPAPPAGRPARDRPAPPPQDVPAEPAQRRPPRKRGKGARSGPGPRLYFVLAGALGAVVLLAAALVAVLGGGDEPIKKNAPGAVLGRPAASGPSPASYSSSPSTSAFAAVAQRASDAAPLTTAEMFPASATTVQVPEAKAKLTLRAKRLDGDCAAAVWGAPPVRELGRGGCSQAVRGLYADTKKGYALAVTVFNLAGVADADRVVQRLGRGRGGGFVRPLDAKAPLDKFGRGYGMARGLAVGHYAVVAWSQRLDGKGDERDETLLSLLIEGGKARGPLGRVVRAN